MIDIHTHPCRLRDQNTLSHFDRTGEIPPAAFDDYLRAIEGAEKAVVLAFDAPASRITVSNEFVSAFVQGDPERLIGFASVDPRYPPKALSQLEKAVAELNLKGVKLAPVYQHFSPHDADLWPLYARIQELRLPILWHQGTSFMAPEGPLEDSRPVMLDRVARAFPDLRMVIAHFGYPWSGEVVALLGRHAHVYTDISVLADRPWFLYTALVGVLEYGVEDKVLLGSDYPAFTTSQTVAALDQVSDLAAGTHLPRIPPQLIADIINRDSLTLLGLR